jgi:hypothetical protein
VDIRLRACLFTTLVIIFSGCQFVPDEENFVVLPEEPVTTIGVDLNDLGDTIQLVQPLTINYDLSFPKTLRHVVTVTIGDAVVHESQTLHGSFNLTPFQFADGFYEFTMQIITNSGTNSLADNLGYEALLFEVKKTVWVEKSPPQKINIISAERVNGNLVLKWEKYPKINFQKYLLYKRVLSEETRHPSVAELYTISDRNQTTFIDPTYIGGEAIYYMVSQITTSSATAQGDFFNHYTERAKIKQVNAIGGQVELKWSKPKFYNAFQKYWLRKTADYANPFFQSTNINDTTFVTTSLGFGKSVELELNTVPVLAHSGGGPSTAMYSTYKEVFVGENFPEHDAVFSNAAKHVVYYYNDGFLYVANEGEIIPYASVQVTLNESVNHRHSFGLSRDGQLLYVGTSDMLIQLNPVTLEVVSSQALSDILAIADVYPYAIAVGDQNLISVDVKVPNPLHQNGFNSDFIAIIDGSSFTVTDTIGTVSDILTLMADANFTYLYENNIARRRLFEIDTQGEEVRRKNFGNAISGEGYFTGNTFYNFMMTKKSTIDLTTLAITQETSIADWLYNISIDHTAGEVSGVNPDGYFLSYSIGSMQQLKNVKLYDYALNDIFQYYVKVTYDNGVLYSGRGFRLQLN